MDLIDVIRICFSQGKTWYTHADLQVLIKERYEYNYGIYVTSKMIRRTGIIDKVRRINGKAVRGFLLEIKDYNMDQIGQIYNTTKKTEMDVPVLISSRSPEAIEKKIRFLMRDWDSLPQWCKMDYRTDKEKFLKEIQYGCNDHKTEWFYKILNDLYRAGYYLNFEGKDIDFTLEPANDIVRHLHDTGATKRTKRPSLDKMHYVLTKHKYVRINDYVYGKLIVNTPAEGLPDWEV